jgi:hypothetical protein
MHKKKKRDIAQLAKSVILPKSPRERISQNKQRVQMPTDLLKTVDCGVKLPLPNAQPKFSRHSKIRKDKKIKGGFSKPQNEDLRLFDVD